MTEDWCLSALRTAASVVRFPDQGFRHGRFRSRLWAAWSQKASSLPLTYNSSTNLPKCLLLSLTPPTARMPAVMATTMHNSPRTRIRSTPHKSLTWSTSTQLTSQFVPYFLVFPNVGFRLELFSACYSASQVRRTRSPLTRACSARLIWFSRIFNRSWLMWLSSYHPLPVVFDSAKGAKCVTVLGSFLERPLKQHIGYGIPKARNISTCCPPTREPCQTFFL